MRLGAQLCIITGGNAVIGKAFGEAAFRHGAHVILACRSKIRGAAAAKVAFRAPSTSVLNIMSLHVACVHTREGLGSCDRNS